MNKILLLVLGIFLTVGLYAQTDLIISEYVEGWSNNKALEIFNPTSAPISLKNYRVTRYSNGADVPPAAESWYVALPDVSLEPYKSFVCVLDKRDPNGVDQEAPVWEQLADRADAFLCPDYNTSKALYHNGDDALALEKTDGTLVDLFARWGAPRPSEAKLPGDKVVRAWSDTSPYFTGLGLALTADHTLIRKPTISTGVKENPSSFNPLAEYDSLTANTFNCLGWHKFNSSPANKTPVFTKEVFEFKVSKTSINGKVIGSVTATDNESNLLKYFINQGNFIYNSIEVRKVPFALNKANGELTLIDAASLTESTTDTIYMKVSVTDGFSESAQIDAMVILTEKGNSVDKLNSSSLKVYPNPVSDNTITISASNIITAVSILNCVGQVSHAEIFASNKKTVQLDLSDTAKGIYLMKVEYLNHTQDIKKIVIQ